ncbi:CLUMA_CG007370, isoform A [Clunio marinus]|uniref:CLUMA_CG007370, isoform A n=1 Tax=Clunio marinus TaxID=568069 RepID=A0A1J1I0W4_9DIPT|nr:CLUMA_CG007370, isoform A [Clunio marinus]
MSLPIFNPIHHYYSLLKALLSSEVKKKNINRNKGTQTKKISNSVTIFLKESLSENTSTKFTGI